MCGIFGFNSIELSGQDIFFDLMAHRGPDARGMIRVNDWTLGHLRLSIIDTRDLSNQPFSKDGAFLVFNGEIYNYKELKREYFNNEKFSTSSDTELLITMLNKFGMQSLNKLNGMFAFAYLSPNGELYLVRDRYGVKPLYYCNTNETFFFSSEIKPLLSVMGKDNLDLSIVESFYKDTATDFDSRSGYNGVNSVERGTYIKIIKSNITKIEKWYLGKDSRLDKKQSGNLVDACEEILTDAIRLRCIADVPLAITLSGGVDSTTIYTLIKERLNVPIQPFVFKHSSRSTDESHLAINLARKYGDEPIVIEQSGDYLGDLKSALYHLEFPIWNPSAIAYYAMYREISKRGFKVVIEGHGADEQLGGYTYMIRAALLDALKKFDFLYFIELFRVLHLTNHPGLGQSVMGLRKLKNLISIFLSLTQKTNSFEEVLRDSFDYKILPIVLRAFDRLSMANSIESRMPFMDFRFVEFSRALPVQQKLNKLGNKAILREILKKYGHEEIYLNKTKMGFASDLPALFKDASIKNFFTELCDELEANNSLKFKGSIEEGLNWQEANDLWRETSIQYYKSRHPLMRNF